MAALALAIMVSALSALGATWALGQRATPVLSNALVVWLMVLAIGMLFVGLWRVLHVVRPYRSGAESARLLEGLFQVEALLLALAGGNAVGAWLDGEVAMRTLSTPLESLAVPTHLLGAFTAGLAVFLVLRRVPRQLQALRLKGVLSATAAGEIVPLTIALWFTPGLYSALVIFPSLSQFTTFLVISAAAILGYAVPRLCLTRPNPSTNPRLWLVLPHPKTVPGWPQLADRIARGHRAGPMALVSPPDAVPLGEHLHLADRLGMLDSLFPRLEIEVRDWQRALPPADRSSGVVHRQVHPPVALMPMLLDSYLGPLDQVLLIASCEDDVQIWRGRLPVDRTRVLWVSPQGSGQGGAKPDSVVGYPVVVMDAKTRGRINMQGWFSSQDKGASPGAAVSAEESLATVEQQTSRVDDFGLAQSRTKQPRDLSVSQDNTGNEEHADTLISTNNPTNPRSNQGDFTAARTLQEEELEANRRILGEEHPDTLTSMNNLAVTFRNQGDLPGARALEEKVLEARRRVLARNTRPPSAA